MASTTAAETPAAETSDAELTIGGMTCASCAARVEKKLNRMDGVTATVNYATEKARVSYGSRHHARRPRRHGGEDRLHRPARRPPRPRTIGTGTRDGVPDAYPDVGRGRRGRAPDRHPP